MARINVSQETVLNAVVARIIAAIPTKFNASNCFVSLKPVPVPIPTHDIFCTVGVADSQFDQSIIEGAGQNACAEDAGVVVTVGTRIRLDQLSHHKMALTDSSRGLLPLKRLVLKALVAHDLLTGSDTFLRNLMMPLSSSFGSADRDNVCWCSITFSTDFDWDLAT